MRIVRHTPSENMTLGTWYLPDGRAFCWTCEDVVRAPGVVVPKMTAIPAGVHTLELSDSPHFGRPLPHIYSDTIPASRGIRVHRGRDDSHTEGCVLVGFVAHVGVGLGETAEAEKAIVELLAGMPEKKTTIEISGVF